MYDPAADLITLKKICVELQRELAPVGAVDKDKVANLAEEAAWLSERIFVWAQE